MRLDLSRESESQKMRPFDALCMKVPQLRQIEARAFGYRHECRGRAPVCANWIYCNGPDFPSMFVELVLLLRHDPAGFELAQRHLLEILPDCRECACSRSVWVK